MSIFLADCPHCGAGKAAFNVLQAWVWPGYPRKWNIVSACPNCGKVVAAILERISNASTEAKVSEHPVKFQGNLKGAGFSLSELFPSPRRDEPPEHIPDDILHYFEQAERGMSSDSWDAAAMYRTAIEMATEILGQTNGRLVERIAACVAEGKITPQLGALASLVRVGGNAGPHAGRKVSEAEAKALKRYTEAFLTLVCTIPGIVEEARNTAGDANH